MCNKKKDNTPTKRVLTPYLCHSRFPRNQISLFDITPRPTCFKNSTNGFARKFDTIITQREKNPEHFGNGYRLVIGSDPMKFYKL